MCAPTRGPWRSPTAWSRYTLLLALVPCLLGSVTGDEESCANEEPQPVESRGVFPRDCKWREMKYENGTLAGYQYSADGTHWVDDLPKSCLLEGLIEPEGYDWGDSGPVSRVDCAHASCTYTNLWYNNGRWYSVVDTSKDKPVASFRMSRNQEATTLHTKNAEQWLDSINWRIVEGDTLMFDYNFYLHPTAIGHWNEMLFPMFSVYKTLRDFKRPADQILLLHLKRTHVMEWVRAVAAVAFGVPVGGDLPPVLFQEETESLWNQITSPLEGYPLHEWVCFRKVLVIKDLYTGGGRTFLNQNDAKEFRANLYRAYGLTPPQRMLTKPYPPPRTITFQVKRANRRVTNQDDLVKLLETYAPVNIVEFNSTTSFGEQLRVMSETGLFVAVHTSNLANSAFLPSASGVFEIIQRHWNWNQLDRTFKDQTTVMGDIHHFAYRCHGKNETVYLNERDHVRVGNWTNTECFTEECVEAHTNVDVTVDLVRVKQLLDRMVPKIFDGTMPAYIDIPWPPAEKPAHPIMP